MSLPAQSPCASTRTGRRRFLSPLPLLVSAGGAPARFFGDPAAGRRRQFDPGTTRLGKSNSNGLLGGTGAMLTFADVVDLFTDELAGLSAGRLALFLVMTRTL